MKIHLTDAQLTEAILERGNTHKIALFLACLAPQLHQHLADWEYADEALETHTKAGRKRNTEEKHNQEMYREAMRHIYKAGGALRNCHNRAHHS